MDTRSPTHPETVVERQAQVSPFVFGMVVGAIATLPVHGVIALLIWMF